MFKRISGFFDLNPSCRVSCFDAVQIGVIEIVLRRAGYRAQIAVFIPGIVPKNGFATDFSNLCCASREQRFGDVINRFDNAICDVGICDYIVLFYAVAMNDDLPNQIVVMRTATTMLV